MLLIFRQIFALLKIIIAKVVEEICRYEDCDCEDYCFLVVMPCSSVYISKVLKDPFTSTFMAAEFRFTQDICILCYATNNGRHVTCEPVDFRGQISRFLMGGSFLIKVSVFLCLAHNLIINRQ
jgi:hypothetical protein